MTDFPRGFKESARKNAVKANIARKGAKRPPYHHGNPTVTDRLYEDDEWEFIKAMESFKTANGVRFPTWSDCLKVLKSLDYSKHGSGS